MMLPYVVTTVFVMLFAFGLLPLWPAALVVASSFVALIVLAAAVGSPRTMFLATSQYLSLIVAFFSIRRRWIQFVPPLILWPILMLVQWLLEPVIHTERELFLREFSSFLETSAQVLAALLIALAIEARAPKSVQDTVAVRPATIMIVLLLAVAELACLAVLSPFLPAFLDRWAIYLVIASGVSAILALLLVSWRILVEEVNVTRSPNQI